MSRRVTLGRSRRSTRVAADSMLLHRNGTPDEIELSKLKQRVRELALERQNRAIAVEQRNAVFIERDAEVDQRYQERLRQEESEQELVARQRLERAHEERTALDADEDRLRAVLLEYESLERSLISNDDHLSLIGITVTRQYEAARRRQREIEAAQDVTAKVVEQLKTERVRLEYREGQARDSVKGDESSRRRALVAQSTAGKRNAAAVQKRRLEAEACAAREAAAASQRRAEEDAEEAVASMERELEARMSTLRSRFDEAQTEQSAMRRRIAAVVKARANSETLAETLEERVEAHGDFGEPPVVVVVPSTTEGASSYSSRPGSSTLGGDGSCRRAKASLQHQQGTINDASGASKPHSPSGGGGGGGAGSLSLGASFGGGPGFAGSMTMTALATTTGTMATSVGTDDDLVLDDDDGRSVRTTQGGHLRTDRLPPPGSSSVVLDAARRATLSMPSHRGAFVSPGASATEWNVAGSFGDEDDDEEDGFFDDDGYYQHQHPPSRQGTGYHPHHTPVPQRYRRGPTSFRSW